MARFDIDVFPAYLALWARSERLLSNDQHLSDKLSLSPIGSTASLRKFERKRGGKAMNRVKSRVLWARINPIQAFSLLSLVNDVSLYDPGVYQIGLV